MLGKLAQEIVEAAKAKQQEAAKAEAVDTRPTYTNKVAAELLKLAEGLKADESDISVTELSAFVRGA